MCAFEVRVSHLCVGVWSLTRSVPFERVRCVTKSCARDWEVLVKCVKTPEHCFSCNKKLKGNNVQPLSLFSVLKIIYLH